jgi:hypothetical protein
VVEFEAAVVAVLVVVMVAVVVVVVVVRLAVMSGEAVLLETGMIHLIKVGVLVVQMGWQMVVFQE